MFTESSSWHASSFLWTSGSNLVEISFGGLLAEENDLQNDVLKAYLAKYPSTL